MGNKSYRKRRAGKKTAKLAEDVSYGICPGSSSEFMNFLYDTHEQEIISCWEYPSAEERDKLFLELKNIPDCPHNILIMKGKYDRNLNQITLLPNCC